MSLIDRETALKYLSNDDKEWRTEIESAWQNCEWWYKMTKKEKIKYILERNNNG